MNNKKILVIDDEKDILELFTRVLKEYDITGAINEETALKAITKEDFEIIFLDIVMPNTDCIALLKTIKKTLPKTKIIMMTGFAVEKEINQALKLGAAGVIRKPFEHITDIKRAVERALAT